MTDTRWWHELPWSCEWIGKFGLIRGGVHLLVRRGRLNVFLLHSVVVVDAYDHVPVAHGEVLLVGTGAPGMGCAIGGFQVASKQRRIARAGNV